MLTQTVTAMDTNNKQVRELGSSADTREHREESRATSSVGDQQAAPFPFVCFSRQMFLGVALAVLELVL